MEILFWLVPPVVVTLVAMVWVAWLGREGRGEVDRDVAVRRLAEAMGKEPPAHAVRAPAPRSATAAPASPYAPRARRSPARPAGRAPAAPPDPGPDFRGCGRAHFPRVRGLPP